MPENGNCCGLAALGLAGVLVAQLQLHPPLPLLFLRIPITNAFVLLFLFLPCPLSPPFTSDHADSYAHFPQFLLKQHAAVAVVMMVRRRAEQDKPRLSEMSPQTGL